MNENTFLLIGVVKELRDSGLSWSAVADKFNSSGFTVSAEALRLIYVRNRVGRELAARWGRYVEAGGAVPTVGRSTHSETQKIPDVAGELTEQQKRILEMFGNLDPCELSAAEKSSRLGRRKTPTEWKWSKDSVKFGVISDTHIGEVNFRAELLFAAFDYFAKTGVDFAYHAGDILEGMSGRDGHVYELEHIGFDRQVEAAVDVFCQSPVQIRAITGNHDLWYVKKANAGIDPGNVIERELGERTFKYLGPNQAIEKFGNCLIELFHPGDGTAYALSYKPQKIVESRPVNQRPHLMIIGHYHKRGVFEVDGVEAILAGSICGQTEFLLSKSVKVALGFYVVEVFLNSHGVERIVTEWVPWRDDSHSLR